MTLLYYRTLNCQGQTPQDQQLLQQLKFVCIHIIIQLLNDHLWFRFPLFLIPISIPEYNIIITSSGDYNHDAV